jgi:omega-6 fatty acid desaturase (delta-12 desaturase)
MTLSTANPPKARPAWVKLVAQYQKPSLSVSTWQIVNSFVPYLVLMVLAYLFVSVSYWLTLACSLVAGLFLVRIFIIQHDCGHQSFFKTKQMNNLVGAICGVFTMTPYEFWRMTHAIHHATSGDLDYRGIGDVETRTVKEYVEMKPKQRIGYHIYRNPFMMFIFGPLYMFLINQRLPIAWRFATTKFSKRSLIYTDLALVVIYGILIALFGVGAVLKVQLPAFLVSSTLGVWLFYVQHNYEDTYWRLHPEWSYEDAAMLGSSYYKLPKILQWFSGNIGLHHIHHLSPKIPNYLLQRAYDENAYLRTAHVLTLQSSLQILTSRVALWDEDLQKMVSFDYVHKHYLKAGASVEATPTAKPIEVTPVAIESQSSMD